MTDQKEELMVTRKETTTKNYYKEKMLFKEEITKTIIHNNYQINKLALNPSTETEKQKRQ